LLYDTTYLTVHTLYKYGVASQQILCSRIMEHCFADDTNFKFEP